MVRCIHYLLVSFIPPVEVPWSSLKTVIASSSSMSIKVIEFGPFGCQIDRGMMDDIGEIPEGYLVVRVDVDDDMIVYIDPVRDLIKGEKRLKATMT